MCCWAGLGWSAPAGPRNLLRCHCLTVTTHQATATLHYSPGAPLLLRPTESFKTKQKFTEQLSRNGPKDKQNWQKKLADPYSPVERKEGTGTPVSAAVNKCGPETRRDREVRNFPSYPAPAEMLAVLPHLPASPSRQQKHQCHPQCYLLGRARSKAWPVYDDNCCG